MVTFDEVNVRRYSFQCYALLLNVLELWNTTMEHEFNLAQPLSLPLYLYVTILILCDFRGI